MKNTAPANDTTKMDRKALDATKGFTEALYGVGAMSEEDAVRADEVRRQVGAKPLTLRRLDGAPITETPALAPERIRALREREGASQAVFARYLGVATVTLSQWERGVRRPDGPALRLMGLAERHGLDHIR